MSGDVFGGGISTAGLGEEWGESVGEKWSPLDCPVCHLPLLHPISLPCHHVFCHRCIFPNKTAQPLDGQSQSSVQCSVCGNEANIPDGKPDPLVQYLVDSAQEPADRCANCDRITQPMFFCETCQQPLCFSCKEETHQAKIFSTHNIVPHEERSGLRGNGICNTHKEPFALYSTESKQLICVRCFQESSVQTRTHCLDLEAAHKNGVDRLEKSVNKLKSYQQEVKDQILLHKKLLQELRESDTAQSTLISQTSQQMIDSLVQIRERLLKNVREQREEREAEFTSHLRHYFALIPSIQLYLLSGSMLCSSASRLDFLELSHDLMKRINSVVTDHHDLAPKHTGQLEINFRDEFARALEPFLGLSSILLGGGSEGSGNGPGTPNSPGSMVTGYRRGRRSGGSGYVNLPFSNPNLFRYQLMVDLAGAFGEEFAKVATPTREFGKELASLGREAQEFQRDLTLRRCLIDRRRMDSLCQRGKRLEGRVAAHTILIQDVQPNLQQIWQEQLDRVRRQQLMFREQVEVSVNHREKIRQILQATTQLKPFLQSIARAVKAINPRRDRSPSPAPMEQICSQIKDLRPDPDLRMQAIGVEEEKRKHELEKRKKDDTDLILNAKNKLKSKDRREGRKAISGAAGAGNTGKTVTAKVVERSRSRGGTDPALLSPNSTIGKRKSWVCPSLSTSDSSATVSAISAVAQDRSGSFSPRLDADFASSDVSSLDESFEFSGSTHCPPTSEVSDCESLTYLPPSGGSSKLFRSHTVTVPSRTPRTSVPKSDATEEAAVNGLSSSLPTGENFDSSVLHQPSVHGSRDNPAVVLSTRNTIAASVITSAALFSELSSSQQVSPTQQSSSTGASGVIIPKPPKIPPNLSMVYVEQSTLAAREKVLESLKMTVRRVDVGVSNSPDRDIEPSTKQNT